jgi:hypothetical protein
MKNNVPGTIFITLTHQFLRNSRMDPISYNFTLYSAAKGCQGKTLFGAIYRLRRKLSAVKYRPQMSKSRIPFGH